MPLEESVYEIVRVHYRKLTNGFVFSENGWAVTNLVRLVGGWYGEFLLWGGRKILIANWAGLRIIFGS